MTRTDLRARLLDEIVSIAPDLDPETIDDGDRLQEDLELDSMDILNLMVALNDRLGVAIPEADYPKLAAVGAAVAYRAAAGAEPAG